MHPRTETNSLLSYVTVQTVSAARSSIRTDKVGAEKSFFNTSDASIKVLAGFLRSLHSTDNASKCGAFESEIIAIPPSLRSNYEQRDAATGDGVGFIRTSKGEAQPGWINFPNGWTEVQDVPLSGNSPSPSFMSWFSQKDQPYPDPPMSTSTGKKKKRKRKKIATGKGFASPGKSRKFTRVVFHGSFQAFENKGGPVATKDAQEYVNFICGKREPLGELHACKKKTKQSEETAEEEV
jgi:hypothetical protein